MRRGMTSLGLALLAGAVTLALPTSRVEAKPIRAEEKRLSRRTTGKRLVPPAAVPLADRQTAAQVQRVERAVLDRAMRDMDEWINALPDDSAWRVAFLVARRELASAAGPHPTRAE